MLQSVKFHARYLKNLLRLKSLLHQLLLLTSDISTNLFSNTQNMASSMRNGKDHQSRAFHFHVLGLLVILVLTQRVSATELRVGGSNGWTVPTDPKALSFNQWAEMNRFQIGDSLLFVYQTDKDAVLQVNKEDYTDCNTAAPIAIFNDGNTIFKFNHSGPYYFISGIEQNCLKNESMIVVVMADRSKTGQTNLEYAPSPHPFSEITPSESPVEEESPPHPPNGNGASSKVVGAMGSIGGFLLASSLLSVF